MKATDVGSRSAAGSARLVLCLCLCCVSGCMALIKDQGQVDPVVSSKRPAVPFDQRDVIVPDCSVEEWINYAQSNAGDCHKFKKDATAQNSYDEAGPTKVPPTLRRTEVQAELMTYSDQICDKHIAGIYGTHAGLNFDLGWLTTVLSGGAAVASGRSATNLAAGSALFSGTRSLVNSEIYYGYIGPAVMREIQSLRSEMRSQIVAKRSCGLNQYPPQEAIEEALMYHNVCSFSTGLTSLLSKAGTTRVGEDKLRSAQLKAMTTQLAEKKAELTQLQAANESVATKAQISALNQDIKSLEAVQRFAAVMDPPAAEAAPDAHDEKITDAQNVVAASQDAADAVKANKAASAQAIDAANEKLAAARARLTKRTQDALVAASQSCAPIKIPTMH
ncbi:MAG TPA: hypothetical protein VGC55_10985 [Dokdonella sp.]